VGTFNSPAQFALYLHVVTCLATGYLQWQPGGGPGKIAWWTLGGSAVGLLATGSRGTFSMLCLALVLFVLLARRWRARIAATLVLGGVMATAFCLMGEGPRGRLATVAERAAVDRVSDTIVGQFLVLLQQDPVGKGAGLGSLGARHVVGRDNVHLVESYLGRFSFEMGILGLSAILWTLFQTAVLGWRANAVLDRTRLRPLGHGILVLLATQLLTTPTGTSLDSTPVNVYFWLFLGVLAGMAARVPRTGLAPLPSTGFPVALATGR